MQPAGRFSGKTKMQECRNANVRRDAGAPQSRKAELQKTQNCKTAGGRGGAGAPQSRKAELRENAGLQNCGRTRRRRRRSIAEQESGAAENAGLQNCGRTRRRRSTGEQESGAAGKRGTAKLRDCKTAGGCESAGAPYTKCKNRNGGFG